MNETADEVVVETVKWSFGSPAVHSEYLKASGDDVVPDMIRHATYPFVASMRDNGNDLRPLLIEIGRLYLSRIPPLVASGLSDPAVMNHDLPGFGWLALAWSDPASPDGGDPRGSFWVRRSVGGRCDRTAVLLAGNRLGTGAEVFGLGGSVGLRVVMHVGPPDTDTGRSRVRVTGLSTSALEQALEPTADRIEFDFRPLLRRAVVAAQDAFGAQELNACRRVFVPLGRSAPAPCCRGRPAWPRPQASPRPAPQPAHGAGPASVQDHRRVVVRLVTMPTTIKTPGCTPAAERPSARKTPGARSGRSGCAA